VHASINPRFSQLALSAYRWPPATATIALLAMVALFPERYGLFPQWVRTPLWVLAIGLIVLSTFAHTRPLLRRLEKRATALLLIVVTAAEMAGLARLVIMVFGRGVHVQGLPLLSTAITLWATNVVVFALWHWHLDQGGPERRLAGTGTRPDLLFPQMISNPPDPGWTPGFFDYLFVAFNTSVAFSVTDTAPMTTRAKVIMMTQAAFSLVTMVVVVARAINLF
jgi:hypothetical protein